MLLSNQGKFKDTLAVAALALLLVLSIANFGDNTINYAHWITFGATWFLIFHLAITASKDPFSPVWVMTAYLTVYFFIRPFYVLYINDTTYLFEIGTVPVKPNFFFFNSYLLLCTFIPFAFGYKNSNMFARKIASRLPTFGLPFNRSLLVFISTAILILSTVSYVYVISQLGGLNLVLNNQAALVKAIPDLGFAVKLAWVVFNLYPLGIILLLIANGQNTLWFIATAFGVILCIIIGRRTPLLAMLIPLLIFRHHYVRKLTIKRAALLATILFSVFIAIVAYRILTTSNGSEKTLMTVFASAEYFVWDMNMAILDDYWSIAPLRLGLDFLPYWFRDFLGIDLFYSSFQSIGEATVAVYFPGFPAGIPAGMPATIFMNFGWIGLIVCMYLIGIAARVFFEYMEFNKTNRLITLLIYPVGLLAFFYVIRLGDFWLGFSTQIRFILMAILLALISNHFRIIRHRGNSHAL